MFNCELKERRLENFRDGSLFCQILLLKVSIFRNIWRKEWGQARLGVAKITKESFEVYIIKLESHQMAFSIRTLSFFFKFHYFLEL